MINIIAWSSDLVVRIFRVALCGPFLHLLAIFHFCLLLLLYLLLLGIRIVHVKDRCNILQCPVVFPAESLFVPGFDLFTPCGKLLLKSGLLLSELCCFFLVFLSFIGRHLLALSRLKGKPSLPLLILLQTRRLLRLVSLLMLVNDTVNHWLGS